MPGPADEEAAAKELWAAAAAGDTARVQELIAAGADVCYAGEDGTTVLMVRQSQISLKTGCSLGMLARDACPGCFARDACQGKHAAAQRKPARGAVS
jgi:basic membrane lipoprotein Med (substrate-binding protein (PBP1-ABC) superfamily)